MYQKLALYIGILKGDEKIYNTNINQKKAGVAISSDKVNCGENKITRIKEEH